MGVGGRDSTHSERGARALARIRAKTRNRYLAGGLTAVLAAAGLAACGTSSAATGPVTINFYSFNDPSGAVQTAVTNCTKQSGGKYTISYNKLPAAADDQRLQLARRLAAADPSM